ncbi:MULTISPECIES: arginase family protein [unclassified Paraflavitalea]|jgi:formiminoglutamase|uniref:arginase family protein n=1 Tax=unclassified Paraflavitalea TaxID=2798305 RepID=UPI003D327C1B
MIDLEQILDYLDPINRYEISNDEGYRDGQLGQVLPMYEEEFPDLTEVDIVIVGCPETRGSWQLFSELNPANEIRHQFYAAYYWHQDIKIADIGNVKRGAGLLDTHFALKEVLTALYDAGKTVIVLGGSHDLTLSQYKVFVDRKNIIEAVCVDALIDLNLESSNKSEQFLMEMLTGEPNYIRHYNHIGFQSYYVHPRMLETMDKLRFDCYRVGTVKERIEEMEPVIRSCSLMSFDISAFANSFSPASRVSPNGFNGEEACTLMQYAGMSMEMKSVGVYGYIPEHDKDQLSAKQIAHMLWYFIDGRSRALREAPLTKRDSFREFQIAFGEIDALFLQSKKTGRWWMQLPDEKFIPCSYTDYLTASNNEIPERWFRAQERSA